MEKKLLVPKKSQIVVMARMYKSPRFLNFADRLSRSLEQATKNKRIDNDFVAVTTMMSI